MEDDVDLGGEHGPEIVRISRGMLSVSERGLVFLGRAEEENTMSKRCRLVATDYEDYEEGNKEGEDIFYVRDCRRKGDQVGDHAEEYVGAFLSEEDDKIIGEVAPDFSESSEEIVFVMGPDSYRARSLVFEHDAC